MEQVDGLRRIGSDKEIIPGIKCYLGGKHTFGFQWVSVNTASGTVVLASDIVYMFDNIENMTAIGTGLSSYDAYKTLERILEVASFPSLIVPGHEPKVYETWPMAPVAWNDPDLVKRILPTLRRAVGEENVVEFEPTMGGEDFAYLSKEVPGSYIILGIRNESVAAVNALHTPNFIIDEEALKLGVRTMSLLALDYLIGPYLP